MLKRTVILSVLNFVLVLGNILYAQDIPSFQGMTAENKSVNVPASVMGKYTLLCFAASSKAQTDLESWLEPVYNHFIAKTGIMDGAYDVNVYFIPVFKGANVATKSTLKQKFRENAQQDLWPHILFCENDLSDVQEKLSMTKDNIPYFFLLDKQGKVIYKTNGAYTDEKYDELDEKIE
ncbi:MAG TPA: hypothetical protein PKL85_08485 [Bacteroidia bacterium]|nr:hypothetical protein [Bacteroidia bacterium]